LDPAESHTTPLTAIDDTHPPRTQVEHQMINTAAGSET